MRVGRIGEEGKTEIREKKKKSYPIVGFKHGVHKKKVTALATPCT